MTVLRPITATSRRLFAQPVSTGRLTLPPPGLVALATIGGILLLVVAVTRWATPSDEHAYWLAAHRLLDGAPLYDPSATPVTPYAYWYPPVVAQVLAPVALVLPSLWFTAAWTLLLLGCLLWLADRQVLVALAMVAFPPVAVEFWFRNVHLVLAVLLVLGIRRSGSMFSVGAGIKLSPGLGLVWLAAKGRWRAAFMAAVVGCVILVVSVALSPGAWADWIGIATGRGPGDVASFIPLALLGPGGGRAGGGRDRSAGAAALGRRAARDRRHHRAAHAVDDRAQHAGGRRAAAQSNIAGPSTGTPLRSVDLPESRPFGSDSNSWERQLAA